MKTVFATDKILDSASAGQGEVYVVEQSDRAYQVVVTGTGAVAAVVKLHVSLDGVNFIELVTFTLSGTGSATDGIASSAPWRYIKAEVVSTTGTVKAFVGV